jgi:hypothetical protein
MSFKKALTFVSLLFGGLLLAACGRESIVGPELQVGSHFAYRLDQEGSLCHLEERASWLGGWKQKGAEVQATFCGGLRYYTYDSRLYVVRYWIRDVQGEKLCFELIVDDDKSSEPARVSCDPPYREVYSSSSRTGSTGGIQ